MKNNYLLITPCKDEEKSLNKLFESVINQKIRPVLWVIINDGSKDNSRKIIESFSKNHDWIYLLDIESNKPRDSFFHYSFVCIEGFNYAIDIAKNKLINYEFIGLTDADIILENSVFEKLIDELIKNAKLGLVSGGIYYELSGELELEHNKELFGTPRLWKKNCFFQTGGYQLTHTPDIVSNIKCLMNGWMTKQVKDAIAIQTRKTFSAEGLWKGWKNNGFANYKIGFHPIFSLIKSIKYCFVKPYYIGIAYFIGYSSAFFTSRSRINDKEVIYYNSKIRLKREWRRLLKKKGLLK